MRLQLTLLCVFICGSAIAVVDDPKMKDLFKKYDRVMTNQDTALVDEVFSEKFLKADGGKASFIEKIKSGPKGLKALPVEKLTWKKGVTGKMYFAKLKIPAEKNESASEPEFIVVEENGKLKIDGTISDGE